ncbi:MAG: trehalose-phosphatase [Thermoleophilia bacterium]
MTVPSPELTALLAPFRDRPGDGAVFCDVDGTLAPIVARPELSRLLDGVPEALVALRGRVRLLGFVSGRGLADVERLVGIDGCAYAGNHGMELHRAGEAPALAPGVADHLAHVASFAARWSADRLAAAGLRLEEKGATLSIHARGAPDPAAAARMLDEIADDAGRGGLALTAGREVLEVRPPIAVDKGTAVRALLDGTGARNALFVGDDRTDADAWRALRELREEGALDAAVGIAVAAGEVPAEVRAAADAEVEGPEGALALLRHLAGADRD